MNLVRLLGLFTVAFLIVGLLGLNAIALGERVWDEDSQTYITVTPSNYVPPAPVGLLDRQSELLWDDTHDSDGDDLYGNYSILAGYMPTWGVNPTQLSTGPITPAILADYDILVLIDNEIAYTPQEIIDIQDWIDGGGKLLMIGENSGAFNMASNNELLAPYNMQFISVSTSYADNFNPHPITQGLTRISWGAGSALDVNAPANAFAWDASMNYTIATNESGVTVVIIDDSGMMNNSDIMNDDNLLCMQNTLEWLAGAGGPPDVSVTLVPVTYPIQIPATGGSFDFYAFITNNGTSSVEIDGWTWYIDPMGVTSDPLMGPATINLEPGTRGWFRTQNVAGTAIPGVYEYIGNVGVYPDTVWDSSSFTFEKLASGDGSWIGNWANWGDPFGDELVSRPSAQVTQFALHPAHPNPFNPSTTLSFEMRDASFVNLSVYDITGRQVVELVNGWRDAGIHEVTFDASNLASGVYIYLLNAAEFTARGKILLLK